MLFRNYIDEHFSKKEKEKKLIDHRGVGLPVPSKIHTQDKKKKLY